MDNYPDDRCIRFSPSFNRLSSQIANSHKYLMNNPTHYYNLDNDNVMSLYRINVSVTICYLQSVLTSLLLAIT